MNSLADVVKIENDRRSSGDPACHVSHTAATLMMAPSFRCILNGRFAVPSFFHSKNPLSGMIHRCRTTRLLYRRLSNTVSLLALIVEIFVLNSFSQRGTSCQRMESN